MISALRAAIPLLRAHRHVRSLTSGPADPGEEDERIDVVYLWRDPGDALWLEKRQTFLEGLDAGERGECNRPDLRWLEPRGGRRLGTLRWSLRSLTRFFPESARIHIVADSARPAWMVDGHERLAWIDSRNLVEEPCPYPSYSSQAIESFLYLIPGLGERFVYFNDDFFLGRPVGAGDFFWGSRIKVQIGRGLSPKGEPSTGEAGDTSAHKNSNRLLDETFGAHPRLTVRHRPYALSKSLYSEAEARFPRAFHETRRHRFRSLRTYALHSCLVPYMALYAGKAIPVMRPLAKDMMFWSNDLVRNERLLRRLAHRGGDFGFCVQGNAGQGYSEEAVTQFEKLMAGLFPEQGTFERKDDPVDSR